MNCFTIPVLEYCVCFGFYVIIYLNFDLFRRCFIMSYSLLVREYTVEHIPEITLHMIVFRIWIAVMISLIGIGVFRQVMLIKNNKEQVKDKIFVLHIFVSVVLFCMILLLFHEVSRLDHILSDIQNTGHAYSNFHVEFSSMYAFMVGTIVSISVVLFFVFRKYIFGFIPVCLLFIKITAGGADYIFYIFITILCGFYVCLNIFKPIKCSVRKYIFGVIPICVLFMTITAGGADYIFYIFIAVLCGFYVCFNIFKSIKCSGSMINKIEWAMVLYVMICPSLFMLLAFAI